ncbi:HDOD domain-containing protein [Cellvibrio japonicus]|uniref:PA5346-like protein n=1 Tax=Cellvibrio japonicus (strain Ueda107) TaxID=498211 RepID=B3PG36_CELJU|nr:HDOD domain-containing protein [Cellvibrio japonicus]ACE85202.1 PA5346-like protein [Cellvibrio japonicus Ueda107]QEI13716.1 HDOD domain-containing protein [Cellvibrio japonicus]QEI17290.1 HDOD domain-containing protein [Cellvibrio japonicus]QEI20867.1 HDOD domain-containing protein [Cellvibrio japonicus]
MPVPTSVQSLLSKQNAHYQVSAIPVDENERSHWHDQHLRNMSAAKSVILQDTNGRVQVIHSADSLLDLKAVNRQLGRDLHAASPEEVHKFCVSHNVHSVPALPKVAGLLTLVDRSLVERNELWVDCGDEAQLLRFSRDDFRNILEDAQICDIAVPLLPLEQDDSNSSDSEQILGAVRNFTQLRVKQRLEETLELPPLSDTAQRIIKLRVNPNADISDLAQIVETDPSLAAQVVSWAASPYYSAPGKIKSIHDAIVRVLGFDMVLNLALGLSLGKTLTLPKEGPHGVMPYWQQAVYMAATIEGLVTAIPRDHRPSFGMAYLCGLLHNFGYLILSEVFPPYYHSYCQFADANPHVGHNAIERHLLGITREQLASALMSLWSMPEEVVVGLRYQNNPHYQGEHSQYAKLIFVAQRLLRYHGIGRGPKLPVPQQVYDDLHLDPEKANNTVANIIESSEDLKHIACELTPHGH